MSNETHQAPVAQQQCAAHRGGFERALENIGEQLADLRVDNREGRADTRKDIIGLHNKLDTDVMTSFQAALRRWPTSVVVLVTVLVGIIGGLIAVVTCLVEK